MPGTIDLRQSDPLAGEMNMSRLSLSAADLHNVGDAGVVDRVRVACLDTGFFCIEPDAGLRSLITATVERMQLFFDLDDDDPRKQAVRQDDKRRGWRPRFTEPAYQPGTISSLEAFDFGHEDIAAGDGDNCWPDVEDFRSTTSQCWSGLHQVAGQVLELLALAAGIERDFFRSNCSSRALNSMRLLHYAADNPRQDERNVGISAHTDFECITLLYQDAPGLELQSNAGDWWDAGTSDGRLIVMLDDMLERWTNGYFTATGHRVRETTERRFSIVLFVAVDDDVTVAPLKPFVSRENPSRYAAIKPSQHLQKELERAVENAKRLKG